MIIVPLSIFGLVLTTRSDRSLDNAIGNDYKALAQRYSNEVSEYIRDRVADANAMAADTSVISAVSAVQGKTLPKYIEAPVLSVTTKAANDWLAGKAQPPAKLRADIMRRLKEAKSGSCPTK